MNTEQQCNLDRLSIDIKPDWLTERINEAIANIDKQREEFIEKHLRLNAMPIIKGAITRGKLKWRGIKYAECVDTNEFWILQRGKQISPKLKSIVEVKIV